MVEDLASNALYRKYEEEKSLLEAYDHVSSLTYEEWLEAKKQNNVKEDIHYWMSKCVSLQQELDIANEKLANVSLIKWQTGEPTKTGMYLIYTIDDEMQFDNWSTFLKQWSIYYNYEVTAWCKLSDIEPYKEEKK